MRSKSASATKKLALSSILSALGVIILYFGGILDILNLTAVAVASLIVYFAYIELQDYYPWMIYGVTGILAFLFVPDRIGALCYILFGGIYPILKAYFERLHPAVSWILKFSLFNTSMSIIIALSVYVLHLPDDELGFRFFTYLLGNVAFLLYDIAMSKLILLYLVSFRNRLSIGKFFRR